ncbi:LacI family transcriptional regulator [Paenibacillus spiritus]|uniref:LacI family transcriptional regulator n=1 Tax=Paenibacillus spiritus TaxID=2496557 RepID=A0A5J5GMD7_9BACL|nr:LacI family DNA-binding transcriptional regulator [Paenibacillus spiritus]KAA9008654.1 LacI family transcriptional regulator [Paenibacillus spiritus]
MTSIKDVAREAGVSVTTVSRVLNNRGYIGSGTRRAVESAMRKLDYQPNGIARALQKSQSFFLGMIVPDSSHPFFGDLLKAVEREATHSGYKLLVCNSLDNPGMEEQYIGMLRQNRVDGIVMCSHTPDAGSYARARLPIVSFDRVIAPGVPSVGSDNYRGGELATEHLIAKGRRRLLHLSGPLGLELLSNRRRDAFAAVCRAHGDSVTGEVIEADHNGLGYEYFRQFMQERLPLQELRRYDGVFCSNDIAAYALCVHAAGLGIAVPKELAIVGYDGHSFTQMLQTPRLTTIRQPIGAIGGLLARTVIGLIEKEEIPARSATVDVELIQGDTT